MSSPGDAAGRPGWLTNRAARHPVARRSGARTAGHRSTRPAPSSRSGAQSRTVGPGSSGSAGADIARGQAGRGARRFRSPALGRDGDLNRRGHPGSAPEGARMVTERRVRPREHGRSGTLQRRAQRTAQRVDPGVDGKQPAASEPVGGPGRKPGDQLRAGRATMLAADQRDDVIDASVAITDAASHPTGVRRRGWPYGGACAARLAQSCDRWSAPGPTAGPTRSGDLVAPFRARGGLGERERAHLDNPDRQAVARC